MSTKKDKKVLLVLPRWYPNETDIQLGIFIQRQAILIKEHFEVYVVYVHGLENLNTAFKRVSSSTNEITEHKVYFKTANGPFKKLINFYRYQKAQKIALRDISQEIDLCHVHVPYRSALPAIRLNAKNKIPFLITEHWSGHLNGNYKKKNFIDKFLYKAILKRATKISTASDVLQEKFLSNTGFRSEVIANYIEKQTEPVNSFKSDWINVLSVSDLDDRTKNIKGLITAFSYAYKANPKLKLTLIGGGPDESGVRQLVEQLEIPEQHINLTGRKPHEEVLMAMQRCDFYVTNSRYETFGMTIAEALYCGKPVVSTRCGGPESFLNSHNSLLLDPVKNEVSDENWKPLFTQIIKMSETYLSYDPVEITASIERSFGEESTLKKWLDFYNIEG